MEYSMNARYIVFTKRAFNAIVTETIDKHPLETGGIFIGYILDNGIWIVVETIPPGIETINQRAYFEYDANFINYLSNVIAKQYKRNLQVLGLWHRHPSSMDTFSSTDDDTNVMFARANPLGAISGLVNWDPKMRLTMYHVDSQCHYTKIDWIVDDSIIPEELLALRFTDPSEFPILGRSPNTDTNVVSNREITSDRQPPIIGKDESKSEYTETVVNNGLNEKPSQNTLSQKLKKCLNILRNESYKDKQRTSSSGYISCSDFGS
jgi:integrative and conjugative element protein (TIGR02256 family)